MLKLPYYGGKESLFSVSSTIYLRKLCGIYKMHVNVVSVHTVVEAQTLKNFQILKWCSITMYIEKPISTII